MRSERSIAGLSDFLDGGVYTSMPAKLPAALRDRTAMVAGAMPEGVEAALRLADWCRGVKLVTAMRTRAASLRGRTNVSILRGSEIVCVDGIGQLECVLVREIRTGVLSAHTASALFLLRPHE